MTSGLDHGTQPAGPRENSDDCLDDAAETDVAFGLLTLVAMALPATAQQPSTPTPPPAKEEEVPFWAIGKPKTGPGAAMAPVPAFPIATPADKLPIAQDEGAAGLQGGGVRGRRARRARAAPGRQGHGLRQLAIRGRQDLRVVDKGGKREVKTLVEKLELPNGIEFHKGSLYVATPKADHALRQYRGQARQARATR